MPGTPSLVTAAAKVVLPAAAILLLLLVARKRSADPRAALGLTPPPIGATLAWLALYAAFILGTNAVMDWRGPWDFTPWRTAPLFVNICRVLGVCFLGPIAEELVFRGLLYDRITRSKLDPRLGIAILAAAWAVMHVSYTGGVITLLFAAGILLGLARRQTGSVITPIAMHILWNLYAVW